jgi:hypothetical protein
MLHSVTSFRLRLVTLSRRRAAGRCSDAGCDTRSHVVSELVEIARSSLGLAMRSLLSMYPRALCGFPKPARWRPPDPRHPLRTACQMAKISTQSEPYG